MLLQGTDPTSLYSIIIPLAIVLVFTGLLLAVLSMFRRRMKVEESTPRDFTLTDLRELHRQGKMTTQEFERAKALMVEKVQSKLAQEVKPTKAAQPFNTDLKSDPGD